MEAETASEQQCFFKNVNGRSTEKENRVRKRTFLVYFPDTPK
jgi:hypothetical protein